MDLLATTTSSHSSNTSSSHGTGSSSTMKRPLSPMMEDMHISPPRQTQTQQARNNYTTSVSSQFDRVIQPSLKRLRIASSSGGTTIESQPQDERNGARININPVMNTLQKQHHPQDNFLNCHGNVSNNADCPTNANVEQTANASFLQYAQQRRRDSEQKRWNEQRQDYYELHHHKQQHLQQQQQHHHGSNSNHTHAFAASSSPYSQVNNILGSLHQERKHRTQGQQCQPSSLSSAISIEAPPASASLQGFRLIHATGGSDRKDSLSSLSTFASTASGTGGNGNGNRSRIMRPKMLQTDSRLF